MIGVLSAFFGAATAIAQLVHSIGIPGVVTAVLGGPVIGALVTYWLGRHKPKIEKRDADLAAAEASQGMSLALAKELREELGRMGARISSLEDRLENETKRREHLESEVRDARDVNYRLRVILSRASEAWEYISEHWSTVRLQETPPHFPDITLD